jgi:hypothetical protein
MTGRCVAVVGLALAGAAAVLAIAGPARAQEPAMPPAGGPPLVVFHAPAQAPGSVASARAELAAVAQARGTALLDLSPEPPPRPEAGQHLRRAIEAYQSFDYERAQAEIQAVLDEVGRTGGAGLSAGELGDAHIHAALVATERGNASAAWEHFVHAVVLDPSRRLDPVRYPPRVVESFERALAAVGESPPAAVRVDVDRACEVALDGRPAHPGDTVPVARGAHYLRVRCAGHADHGGRVLVADDSVTLQPELVAEARPSPAALRGLAGQRGAARVLAAVAVVAPGAAPTLTLALLDVATGKERGRVLVSLAEDSPESRTGLRRAAERLLDDDLEPRARPAPAAGPTPWYRRPWVWGVTGVAVGAAVLLPFVLDRDGSSGFDVRPGGELP